MLEIQENPLLHCAMKKTGEHCLEINVWKDEELL